MKSKLLFPVDPKGLDDVARALLEGTSSTETETRSSAPPRGATNVSNPADYIILPGKTHGTYSYANTLITMDRVHLGKNWVQCQEALAAEDSFMPTVRQYMDFLIMLKAGNVYDGRGSKLDSRKVNAVLNDILEKKDPYRGVWLDADFKVVSGRLHINYNHRKVGRDVKPQNSEPLESCLMENCYIDINSANKQGLPTRKSTREEIYYWKPLEDNNSVVGFVADSVWGGLSCYRNPASSDPGLGVRAAKIKR